MDIIMYATKYPLTQFHPNRYISYVVTQVWKIWKSLKNRNRYGK